MLTCTIGIQPPGQPVHIVRCKFSQFPDLIFICSLNISLSAYSHGLKVLGTHYRTNPGSSRSPITIVDNGSHSNKSLSGRPNGCYTCSIVSWFLMNFLNCFKYFQTPHLICGNQLNLIIFDRNINRFGGFTGNHNPIPAGSLQLMPPESSCFAISITSG
ncbi:hypothetical protein ES705_47284 [subsurface metagenome]